MTMKILPLLLLGSAFAFGQTKAVIRCWQTTATFDEYNACLKKPTPKPAGKKKAAKPVEQNSGILTLTGQTSCKVVPAGDGCNSCTVCESAMGTGSTCTAMYCAKTVEMTLDPNEPAGKYLQNAPGPADVPAIQVDDEWGNCSANAGVASRGKDYECLIPEHWTCPDKHSYTLQTSVDGEVHKCHRIAP